MSDSCAKLNGAPRIGRGSVCAMFLTIVFSPLGSAAEPSPLQPVVEAEEMVYQYEPANNGAGPMWCHGSTCLVRIGDNLFASGIELLENARPLNNCRWTLFQRDKSGWRQVGADPKDRTREPSPLAVFPDGRLFLSVNPTLVSDPSQYGGPARPAILEFVTADPRKTPTIILPVWDGTPEFTEHSYRSFAADGVARELILFQNIGYTHAEWAFRSSDGQWLSQGKLKWPWGAEYDTPQPIRVCYPNVALKNRAVYFCGVSDIMEPYEAWRAFKHELTGRKWDYDFRRLFYTWSPDILTGRFNDWLEIASTDKTGGRITPGDLWLAPDGAAHIVWTERAIDERLRERFFPDAVQRHAMKYAVVREGNVVTRRTLMLAEEGKSAEIPARPRFQATPDNRLFVFYYVGGTDTAGRPVSENRILELDSEGTPGPPLRVPLRFPMNNYFTATVRAGSPPSRMVDLLGTHAEGKGIHYARVRLYE